MFEPGKLSHLLSPVNGEGGGVLPDAQRPDPFTLEGIIAWLRTKSGDEEYEYWCDECLIGQYVTSLGYKLTYCGMGSFGIADGTIRNIPPHWDALAHAEPHTFGAALARAEKLLASGRTP